MEDNTPARLDETEEVVIPLETLLSRLDAIERRLAVMERSALRASMSAGSGAAASPALESRIAEQGAELKSLREHVRRTQTSLDTQLEKINVRFRELTAGVPAMVEKQIALRIDDLFARVEKEVHNGQVIILEHLESTLDDRMSDRIGVIEQTLVHQSKSIELLRERTATTDANLQRLVSAIERLFDRPATAKTLAPATGAAKEAPAPAAPAASTGGFASQLEQAIRGTQTPAAAPAEPVKDPVFKAHVQFEKDSDEENKHRQPMTPSI